MNRNSNLKSSLDDTKSLEYLFGSRNYGFAVDMWAFTCIIAEVIKGFPIFKSSNEIK